MSERLPLLDGWRGLACWLMLFYHFAFDLVMFGRMSWESYFSAPMMVLEQFIACSFILCAGISCCFSRSNIRRGFVCALAGLAVVLASYVVQAPILFGILQFLSAAMILYGLGERLLRRIPYKIAPFLYAVLYAASKLWTANTTVQYRWLFWLGFEYNGFISYDYFPILPHIFLFLLGTWFGQWIQRHSRARALYVKLPAVLTWPGRHTLLIYLAHQPLLYGLCWLLYRHG